MKKSNEWTLDDLDMLKDNGFNYIVKARDNFLSGWGLAENMVHIQLIALKTYDEVVKVMHELRLDGTMSYITWTYTYDKKAIKGYVKNKSYTLRNDWVRGLD